MSTLEDTGELHRLAQEVREEINRIDNDPRRPGVLDVMLLTIAAGAGAVVALCFVILTVAPDRFAVDDGRLVLSLAAAGICVAPVLAGMFGMNRAHRKRYERTMERLECNGRKVKDILEANQREADKLAAGFVGLTASVEGLTVNLGLLAARIEELVVPSPVSSPPEEVSGEVHEMTREAYRLGRRSRGND